jgi:hypothetical protein
LRILFIGKKLTIRNDLPGMLTRLIAEARPDQYIATRLICSRPTAGDSEPSPKSQLLGDITF